jgi:hypothetical protein
VLEAMRRYAREESPKDNRGVRLRLETYHMPYLSNQVLSAGSGPSDRVSLAQLVGARQSAQSKEDAMLLLESIRAVADMCDAVTAVQRKITYDRGVKEVVFGEGERVLLFYPEREDALQPFYRGPFVVTAVGSGGFYTVAEVLVGGAVGKPVQAHATRMRPFVSRLTDEEILQRKLPEGYAVMTGVRAGPRESDGYFEVSWAHVAFTTWEPPQVLREAVAFRKYCEEHNLTYAGVQKKKKVGGAGRPAPEKA